MARTIDLYADLVRVVDSRPAYSTTNYKWETMPAQYSSSSENYYRALAHFNFPDELLYNQITAITLWAYITANPKYPTIGSYFTVFFHPLEAPFDASTTWKTKPLTGQFDSSGWVSKWVQQSTYSGWVSAPSIAFDEQVKNVLLNGVQVRFTKDNDYDTATLRTSESSKQICCTVTYEDTILQPSITGSPTGGYLARPRANTFSWFVQQPSGMVGEYVPTGNSFHWKQTDAESYTDIDTGDEKRHTLAANTMPAGGILWYPSASFANGQTFTAGPYAIDTDEPLGTVTLKSPLDTVVDGSNRYQLKWTYSNASGMVPRWFDVQISTDGGTTWQDQATATGGGMLDGTLNIFPGDLPGGTIFWRVRGYNQDLAPGPWSAPGSYISISAPAAPTVTATSAPYATISWQGEGQQAYEVSVDGKSYGTRYGTDKSFTLTSPLSDGQHTASVRIQGVYGLWSSPGTVTFNVSNESNRRIKLVGSFVDDARLSWQLLQHPNVSVWSQGGIDAATGSETSDSTAIRGTTVTDIVSDAEAGDGYELMAYCWDSGGAYMGAFDNTGFYTEARPFVQSLDLDSARQSGAATIRISARRTDGGAIVPADAAVAVWYASSTFTVADGYTVFRDGVQIGHTEETRYSDRLALGEHSWYVFGRTGDGYYIQSNTLEGDVAIAHSLIAPAEGGDWLELRLTEHSNSEQGFQRSRTTVLRHVTGARFPVLEISPFEDVTGTYDAAFMPGEGAEAFEALFGRVVMLKTRRGNIIVGPLTAINKRETDFYTTYTFSVQQIHWEGFDA